MDSRAIGAQGRTMGQPLMLIRLDHHPEDRGLQAFPRDRLRMSSCQMGHMEQEKGAVPEGSVERPSMLVVLRRLVGTVCCGLQVPARRKAFGLRLGDELADDLGS
jgi:hypothetical protein